MGFSSIKARSLILGFVSREMARSGFLGFSRVSWLARCHGGAQRSGLSLFSPGFLFYPGSRSFSLGVCRHQDSLRDSGFLVDHGSLFHGGDYSLRFNGSL